MNSLFNFNNPLMRFLSRILDILYLNLLFLLCCLPIITIGPSFSALYYCLLKILRDQDSSITTMFFHSFKTNLKQGISLTLFFIGVVLILLLNIYLCTQLDGELFEYIKIFIYVIFVCFIGIISYAFPFLAQFDNSLKNIIKYSFFLAISNFGYTFIIMGLNSVPFLLFYFLPELFLYTLPGWLTFGFAIIALINAKFFVKIFNKFIPENNP